MNIYELNNILEGEITNLNKINYDNIQTDTRLVNKNSLLFIFNLEHDNAYKYIKNMQIKPAIIVINEYEKTVPSVSRIKVKDTIKAYGILAS